MRFSDVVIRLYEGKEVKYECVKVELHEAFRLLFVHDKDKERIFTCHLDDIMWMEEEATTGEDPIKEQVMVFARNNQKIPAIKKLRELEGLGLKEAKDQVDKWCEEEGISNGFIQ